MKRKERAFSDGEENLGEAELKSTRAVKAVSAAKNAAPSESDPTGFADSMSDAFRQTNEKKYFALIVAEAVIIVVLVVGALSDILTLCFNVNRWFGYTMVALTAIAIAIFVVRPLVKVLGARFFITDVTADKCDVARRRNYRALKGVARALIDYNTAPKNAKYRYLSVENLQKLDAALCGGNREELKKVMKGIYASDVASCVNSLIWRSAGKAFLTTSISQNDKIDALSVLLNNLSMVKQIVGIYGYRPSYAKLFRVYTAVLRNTLIAYGMQNVNWFNVFGKFFAGLAKKIPFLDTIVDSAVQGTVSAFMTVLVGYKTKKYLCSDYKKQERLEVSGTGMPESCDDEVKIAADWAKKIRVENEKTAAAASS